MSLISQIPQVSNSPLNNSSSKQCFSFGKSPRFERKSSYGSTATFYNLPDVLSKRAASIGKGDRGKLFVGQKSNAPYYNIPPDIDPEQKFGKKANVYSFGISREFYKKV